jgi:indole-3-glycerol phosphate synthase
MLDKIIAQKREDVEQRKKAVPLTYLQECIACQKPGLDLAPDLKGDRIRLIAEVKQASPSRGVLSPQVDPTELAQTYAEGGAAAISVLTEENYFMGRSGWDSIDEKGFHLRQLSGI